MKTKAPRRLKITCAIAALRAERDVPIDAMIAVTQVPIFAPIRISIAVLNPIRFCCPKAMTIPVVAEELCIKAVKTAPIKTPAIGIFPSFDINLRKNTEFFSGFAPSDIIDIPRNIIPNPKMI